jgi:hypothetical protein
LLREDKISREAEMHREGRLRKAPAMHPDIEELLWITIKAFGAMLTLVYVIRIGRLGFMALSAL